MSEAKLPEAVRIAFMDRMSGKADAESAFYAIEPILAAMWEVVERAKRNADPFMVEALSELHTLLNNPREA